MSSKSVPSDLKNFLRSVLMSSNGVKESRVERDYLDLAGEKLNWKKLGFGSLHEFLCAIPDVCSLEYSTKDKENRVYAVEVKGIYMSAHAKKNVKCASSVEPQPSSVNAAKKPSLSPFVRKVEQDGDSLKITIDEKKTEGGELAPGKNGLYQVYVANLSRDCTESDIIKSFSTYGNVKEVSIVKSSRNQKIGFVRYALKKDALRALTEGKIKPPVIRGQTVNVGEAKCKSNVETSVNTVLNCEPKSGNENITPLSTKIAALSSSSSPTRSSTLGQPRPTPTASPVLENEMQDQRFSAGELMNGCPEPLNEPLYGVNISGYNGKMSKDNLYKTFQDMGNVVKFEYHPMYSIAKFKRQNEAMKAVREMNGKFVSGSVLLVSLLEPGSRSEDSKKEVKEVDEIADDQFSQIYSLYDEAMVNCCGQSYFLWLNSLPSVFEMKVMDIIDPCTFWVHISDGTNTYQQFNNLVSRLRYLVPFSKQVPLGKNEFGAGRFTEDGEWYRCYSHDVSPDGKQLHVMYIDYGNSEWLEVDKVKRLPQPSFQLRPQGVLARLSGLKLKSNQSPEVIASALLCAKRLLMNGQAFKARKASFDPSKPLVLEVEILQSEGEVIYKELSSLPCVEVTTRSSSSLQPLLLSSPPLPSHKLKPLKEGLAGTMDAFFYIWISNITSPTSFHFQLASGPSREVIMKVQELLLQCDIKNKVDIKNIKGDTLVCYHRNGLERSRVQMLSTSRPLVPGQVNVLHVDIGKETMVPCTSFISLPKEAQQIVFQARPASLYQVPNEPMSQSAAALEYIVQQSNKVLRAYVVKENLDGSVIVELFDTEGESINKKLLEIIGASQATSSLPHNPEGEIFDKTSTSNVAAHPHHAGTEQPYNSQKTVPPLISPSTNTSHNVKIPVTAHDSTSHRMQSRQATPSPTDNAMKNMAISGVRSSGNEQQQNVNPATKHSDVKRNGSNILPSLLPLPSLVNIQNKVVPSGSDPASFVKTTARDTELPFFPKQRKTNFQSQVTPSASNVSTSVKTTARRTPSPVLTELDKTHVQNEVSSSILEPGSPVSPVVNISPSDSSREAQTVVDGTAPSMNPSVVKSRDRNTRESKPPYKETPANKNTSAQGLQPVTDVTSGLRTSLLRGQTGRLGERKDRSGLDRDDPGKDTSYEEVSSWKATDHEDLVKKIEEQEKILSRPVTEQRQKLINWRTKEKLQVQVRIKELENAIFVLENELQSLTVEKDRLEKQLQQNE